ncbi:DMT family transporter [Yinghuangia aomiensis]|uniref:DMT family transporter n=1 Tax=Yinghuangia aomiensis TaxID=676205 RepID=A0ABP9HAU9_9ACTN
MSGQITGQTTGRMTGGRGGGKRWGSISRLVLLGAIWGSSFLWIKIALRGFSPIEVALVRVTLGALVLLAFTRARRVPLPRGIGTWGHLTAAAFFQNALPYALFAFGEQHVDSSVAGVVNATTPLWTMLLAVLVGTGTRLGAAQVFGLFLGFGGVLLILAPWQSGGAFGTGAALIVVAAFSYAVSYMYIDRFVAGRGLDPVAMCGAQLAAAAAMLAVVLPFSGVFGSSGGIAVTPRADAFAAVAVLGVLGTGVAVWLNYRLLVDDGPAVASTVTYLMPPVSVLLGALALDEPFGARMAVGIAIVLGGIALTRRRGEAAAAAGDENAASAAEAAGAAVPAPTPEAADWSEGAPVVSGVVRRHA